MGKPHQLSPVDWLLEHLHHALVVGTEHDFYYEEEVTGDMNSQRLYYKPWGTANDPFLIE
jgi:hypothetical protein